MANDVYSLFDIVLTIDGKHITGLQNVTDAISIETPERVTTVNSIDGGFANQISGDRSGTLNIKLLGTHADNDFMASLYNNLDLGAAAPLNLVTLKKNGGDFVFQGYFNVQGASKGSFGTEMEAREWTLVSGNVSFNPGAMGGH